MSLAAPLELAAFAAALDRLARFEHPPKIAIAVSGGPDSLALAILADCWARGRGGAAWALTVDHRLRPESEAEIRCLRAWLAARGIRHEVLVWSGVKPATGVQKAAREARYRLLAAWCREAGCLHLLTAHHREDQTETHLIRRRAASGADGLAGMSAVRELDGCRLLRPLLGIAKARLIAFLEAEGQPFIADPSNRNPAFERSRLRIGEAKDWAALAGGAALAQEIATLAHRRVAGEAEVSALLAGAVAIHPAGFASFCPDRILAAPAPTAERALGRVAATMGGARYPLRRARVARLRQALAAAPTRARTLGGCRFVPWRGRILVMRELALAAPPVRLTPGRSIVWDRRFMAALPEAAARPVTVGYLGQAGATQAGRRAAVMQREVLPRLLQAILPAFWDDDGVLHVFCDSDTQQCKGASPRLMFRPSMPLTDGGFTVV